MHVDVSHPPALPDLRDFLERAEWVVNESNPHHLEVDLAQAINDRHARRELEVYLATWQVMHPGIEAYVIEIYEPPSRS